jgi:hypothetical protein
MMFVKFPGVKKFCAVWLKTSTTSASARTTGHGPRFPDRTLAARRVGSVSTVVSSVCATED